MADDETREQDSEPTRDRGVPHEDAVEQRPVLFLGDELAAALTAAGIIYISLPGICTALGLNRQAQLRRVLRTSSLKKALRVIPLDTRGGPQDVNCLRVDKVALWLGGIETLSVKPPFRDKIEYYQEELAPVAMQVFLRVLGVKPARIIPASADPQVAALAEQIDTLTDVVTFLREHIAAMLETVGQIPGLSLRLDQAISLLESLAERQDTTETQIAKIDERTQRLTPAHARAVQEMVDRMVRETKHLPVPLTYITIYGRLKHRFRAGSYREVPEDRFKEVMTYLRDELRRARSHEAPEQDNLF